MFALKSSTARSSTACTSQIHMVPGESSWRVATRAEDGSNEIRAHPDTGSELSRRAGAGEMTCVVLRKVWLTCPAWETAICSCQTYTSGISQKARSGAVSRAEAGTQAHQART